MNGTGFLIASNLVLTVAHNVYYREKENKGRFKDLVFYPGVSGNLKNKNVDACKIVDVRYPKEYESCKPEEFKKYDYALLKLDRSVYRPAYIQLGLDYD